MSNFQYHNDIKRNKELSFLDKLLLQDLIFYSNTNDAFASDEYLAETLGTSEKTIQRSLATLDKLGLITRKLVRHKHTVGDKQWYNKRYISINFIRLSQFLSGEDVQSEKPTEDFPKIESTPTTPTDIESPLIETIYSDDVFGSITFLESAPKFDDNFIARQSMEREEKIKALTVNSESEKLYQLAIDGMKKLNFISIENFFLILSVSDESFDTVKMKDDVIPYFKSKNVQDVTTPEHKEKLIQILNNKEYRNYKWKEQLSIQL